MAHRWIAGDGPTYLKFALKVTHPFRTRRFRRISLNGAAVVRASEKSSIIAIRKSTMRLPLRHKWTLCVIPKYLTWWLKMMRIFTFGIALYFFVASNRRHFKFGMWVERSVAKSLQMTNHFWNRRGHITWPIFRSTTPSRPNNISGSQMSVRTSVRTSVRPQKVSLISMKFGIYR